MTHAIHTPDALPQFRLRLRHPLYLLAAVLALWAVASGALHRAAGWLDAEIDAAASEAGLTVQDVWMDGRERTSRQDVLDALGIPFGTPMTAIDVTDARARLEALPWVASAEISRELPTTLTINLSERRAVAIWQNGTGLALIDDSGAVISIAPGSQDMDLPRLVGSGAPAAAADILRMLKAVPALAPRVTAAIRVGERRWDLTLDNGMRVLLPEASAAVEPAEVWQRFARLAAEHQLMERDVAIFDLRFEDRVVVRLTGRAAAARPRRTDNGTERRT